MRTHTAFACGHDTLIGTLDGDPRARTGLVIVSGGNETRAGAWNGQAAMAAHIARQGHAVLRFDRRGVGDSTGNNTGFRHCAPDITAAVNAFREMCPQLQRIAALGNCDAASALMLGRGAGFDALILSNPWTFEDGASEDMPAQQVRAHYLRRLRDPAALRRLLRGKVSLGSLVSSLKNAAAPAPKTESALLAAMRAGLDEFGGSVVFPVAGRDRTGQTFVSRWGKDDPRIRVCTNATHSFVETDAWQWYGAQVLEALRA